MKAVNKRHEDRKAVSMEIHTKANEICQTTLQRNKSCGKTKTKPQLKSREMNLSNTSFCFVLRLSFFCVIFF